MVPMIFSSNDRVSQTRNFFVKVLLLPNYNISSNELFYFPQPLSHAIRDFTNVVNNMRRPSSLRLPTSFCRGRYTYTSNNIYWCSLVAQ